MIKYNNSNINDWYFADDNIIKVYRNNAVCYYKISGGGDTPTAQTPCFAVVENISSYSDTEFVDVYNKADSKWYKLNNLNQYEEYGVYGSGRNITHYEGKLTIDDGYEYIYSGSSWNNVGEVSGSTATLPNVAFTVNYNARDYYANTKTIAKTNGQLADVDAVITAGTPTSHGNYLTITSNTRATISGYQTYFNRDDSNPNLTIISKQKTEGNYCHMFANRDSSYNWMYRPYSTKLTLHGSGEQGNVAVTSQPVIESVRIDSNRLATYYNYTDNTSSTYSNFNYGNTNSGNFALFAGFASSSSEWFVGDFYWVYMSQNTLTDEEIQQVINYNENSSTYPLYYDEKSAPPDNLTFSSMTQAEEYECPWVGMKAKIDGVNYVFSGDSQSGYEWEEVVGPVCDYNFCGVDTSGNDIIISGLTTLGQSNLSNTNAKEGMVGSATITIGQYCFRDVASTLSALTIADSVTTIEHEAFMETSLLTTLTIPSSVETIDFWAFTRCYGLTEVIFEGTTPPSFSIYSLTGVFHDYCPPVIYVPDSALSAYRAISASVWTNQSFDVNTRIKGISERT